MTVADLITELQRLPQHLPVKLLMDEATKLTAGGDEITIVLSEADAVDIDTVRPSGGYVLMRGGA